MTVHEFQQRDRPEDDAWELLGKLTRGEWERIESALSTVGDDELADTVRHQLVVTTLPVIPTDTDPTPLGVHRIGHTVRANRGGGL